MTRVAPARQHLGKEKRQQRSYNVQFVNRLIDMSEHSASKEEGARIMQLSAEGQRTMGIYMPVGRRASVHCTSLGKALIAYQPKKEVEVTGKEKGLPRFTVNTIVAIRG